MFAFLCLAYFTFQAHLHCHKWQDFILFHGWIIFHCVCVHHIFIIHLLTDSWVNSVSWPLWKVWNKHGCADTYLFSILISFSLDIYPIVWLLDHMIVLFTCLRLLHTASHNGCTNLHSHQECLRGPLPLHPHQQLFFFIYLIIVTLTEDGISRAGILITWF